MEKKVTIIPPKGETLQNYKYSPPVSKKTIRVAAYCRVSTAMEAQQHSYEAQVKYYTKYIEDHDEYTLAGIYGDNGKSGRTENGRDGFRQLLEDCRAGKIDMVITKSVSRFARNTQDCLKYSRQLKKIGIPIFFEKERINSMDGTGELFFTILSSLAQEESRNLSENVKWAYRANFKKGKVVVNAKRFLGFDKDENGRLVINQEQAKVVRLIYDYYEVGYTEQLIAATLNASKVPGIFGEPKWESGTIKQVLTNEKYKGDLCLQKTYVADYLNKRSLENTGQVDKYYVKNDHEPIIPPDEWEAVQEEMKRMDEFRELYHVPFIRYEGKIHPFKGKIVCAECHEPFAFVRKGVLKCRVPGCMNSSIREGALKQLFLRRWNELIEDREHYMIFWRTDIEKGTPLQRLRARQMIKFTEQGKWKTFDDQLALAVIERIEIWHGDIRIWLKDGSQL